MCCHQIKPKQIATGQLPDEEADEHPPATPFLPLPLLLGNNQNQEGITRL